MKILLLAGEESGVLYARQIRAEVLRRNPAAEIRGYEDEGFRAHLRERPKQRPQGRSVLFQNRSLFSVFWSQYTSALFILQFICYNIIHK